MNECTFNNFSFLGMIHRLEGRDDLARKDFDSAAQLGSSFAKSALAAMNPYAAMCNQMLKNVFSGKLSFLTLFIILDSL